MSAAEKRCYYEVLGLPQTCTPDEIRSSYKKLALQRHPDKLIQSGVASVDATASFQELVRAYEVLSDPKERSWYDSHRSQILYAQISTSSGTDKKSANDVIPDLFSYFSASCYTDYRDEERGFYRVYGEVFERVYMNEVNYCRRMGLGLGLVKEAPLMGNLGSEYEQVSAFYGYWSGFTTVMDFGWVEKWDAMAGENRKARRVMEEENKKVRKKARREYNETVRGLAEFVKKRDKRVIDMSVRREKERERKREEETKKKKERERERLEKARAFEDPQWARIDEEDAFGIGDDEDEEDEEKRELYCAACGKKFKSDKQWKNHEQSKKHKERVAHLKKFFIEEDGHFEGVQLDVKVNDENEGGLEVQEDVEVNDEGKDGVVDDGFVSAEDDVDDLRENVRAEVRSDDEDVGDDLNEKFKECVGLEEGKDEDEVFSDDGDVGNAKESSRIEQPVAASDEDESILEAMITGRRRGKHVTLMNQSVEKNVVESDDEMDAMEYNNKKCKKKSRRAKKDKGKAFDGSNESGENSNAPGGSNVASNGDDDDDDDDDDENHGTQARAKGGKKAADRKSKRDAESKPKNPSKGRKQKEKDLDPVCEKCGHEFDSRNKLYKHLSDTGHASLKSR